MKVVYIADRFWEKVDKSGDCWLWTKSLDRKGYGQFEVGGSPKRAHRVAWELTFGPVPDGLFVLHRCDNPPCVRPEHLFLGTNTDNVQDMDRKGRRITVAYHGEEHANARLTTDQAVAVRERALAGENQHRIAAAFGISNVTVSAIKRGRLWSHLS